MHSTSIISAQATKRTADDKPGVEMQLTHPPVPPPSSTLTHPATRLSLLPHYIEAPSRVSACVPSSPPPNSLGNSSSPHSCLRVEQANGSRPPAPPAAAPHPPARPLRPAPAAAASAHRRAVHLHLHLRRPPLGLREALRSRPRQRRHRVQGAAPAVRAAGRAQALRGRGHLRGARGRDTHARRGRAPRRAPPRGDPVVGRRRRGRGGARGAGAGAHAGGLPLGPAPPAGPPDGGAAHRRRGAAGAPRSRRAPRAPRRAPRSEAVEPARRRRR